MRIVHNMVKYTLKILQQILQVFKSVFGLFENTIRYKVKISFFWKRNFMTTFCEWSSRLEPLQRGSLLFLVQKLEFFELSLTFILKKLLLPFLLQQASLVWFSNKEKENKFNYLYKTMQTTENINTNTREKINIGRTTESRSKWLVICFSIFWYFWSLLLANFNFERSSYVYKCS